MSLALKKRIYEIYEAFSAAELDQLADAFDENVDFITNAPTEVFPYLGRRLGKAEVVKALRGVHGDFESASFMPIWMVTENDAAGVLVSIKVTQRATGRVVRFFAAHFLRFRDGRIVEYRAIMDSLEAVQQALGREFDLSKEQEAS